MNQYKLKYATQSAAEKDIKAKGIIEEQAFNDHYFGKCKRSSFS